MFLLWVSVRLATRKCAFFGQIYHWKSYKFKRYKPVRARVPGQRRLAISRLRVPNLDGAVIVAAGNLLSIGAPCHRCHTVTQKVSTRIQRDREKVYWNKLTNSSARSGSTGNLEIASPRSWSFVPAATGDLFSIWAPRHWCDAEIARSQHTNQQKNKRKMVFFPFFIVIFNKKTHIFEWPVTVDSQTLHF